MEPYDPFSVIEIKEDSQPNINLDKSILPEEEQAIIGSNIKFTINSSSSLIKNKSLSLNENINKKIKPPITLLDVCDDSKNSSKSVSLKSETKDDLDLINMDLSFKEDTTIILRKDPEFIIKNHKKDSEISPVKRSDDADLYNDENDYRTKLAIPRILKVKHSETSVLISEFKKVEYLDDIVIREDAPKEILSSLNVSSEKELDILNQDNQLTDNNLSNKSSCCEDKISSTNKEETSIEKHTNSEILDDENLNKDTKTKNSKEHKHHSKRYCSRSRSKSRHKRKKSHSKKRSKSISHKKSKSKSKKEKVDKFDEKSNNGDNKIRATNYTSKEGDHYKSSKEVIQKDNKSNKEYNKSSNKSNHKDKDKDSIKYTKNNVIEDLKHNKLDSSKDIQIRKNNSKDNSIKIESVNKKIKDDILNSDKEKSEKKESTLKNDLEETKYKEEKQNKCHNSELVHQDKPTHNDRKDCDPERNLCSGQDKKSMIKKNEDIKLNSATGTEKSSKKIEKEVIKSVRQESKLVNDPLNYDLRDILEQNRKIRSEVSGSLVNQVPIKYDKVNRSNKKLSPRRSAKSRLGKISSNRESSFDIYDNIILDDKYDTKVSRYKSPLIGKQSYDKYSKSRCIYEDVVYNVHDSNRGKSSLDKEFYKENKLLHKNSDSDSDSVVFVSTKIADIKWRQGHRNKEMFQNTNTSKSGRLLDEFLQEVGHLREHGIRRKRRRNHQNNIAFKSLKELEGERRKLLDEYVYAVSDEDSNNNNSSTEKKRTHNLTKEKQKSRTVKIKNNVKSPKYQHDNSHSSADRESHEMNINDASNESYISNDENKHQDERSELSHSREDITDGEESSRLVLDKDEEFIKKTISDSNHINIKKSNQNGLNSSDSKKIVDKENYQNLKKPSEKQKLKIVTDKKKNVCPNEDIPSSENSVDEYLYGDVVEDKMEHGNESSLSNLMPCKNILNNGKIKNTLNKSSSLSPSKKSSNLSPIRNCSATKMEHVTVSSAPSLTNNLIQPNPFTNSTDILHNPLIQAPEIVPAPNIFQPNLLSNYNFIPSLFNAQFMQPQMPQSLVPNSSIIQQLFQSLLPTFPIPESMPKVSDPPKQITPPRQNMSPFDTNVISPLSNEDSFSPPSPPPEIKIMEVLNASKLNGDKKNSSKKKCDKEEIRKKAILDVKSIIKPFYSKRSITKEEYKLVMKKCVPKICKNHKLDYSLIRVTAYVEAYIRKVMAFRKHKSKWGTKKQITA